MLLDRAAYQSFGFFQREAKSYAAGQVGNECAPTVG